MAITIKYKTTNGKSTNATSVMELKKLRTASND